MADKSLRTKALQVALRIVGSERALSRHLQVPAADLSKWLSGDETPPQAIFLRTVDLLVARSSVDQLGDQEPSVTGCDKTTIAEGPPAPEN
jgi:hypothetical protein